MKDHEMRELVNSLRDVAVKYAGTQQLRAQISHVVTEALKSSQTPVGCVVDWDKREATPLYSGQSAPVAPAAWGDVIAERQRQVSAEGWTPDHDDTHHNNEMAFAAACYAFHAAAASWDLEDDGIDYDSHPVPKNWPWEPEWWKPKSARADLVRAGALILAEIERLDRAASAPGGEHG